MARLRIVIDGMNVCHIMKHVHKDLKVQLRDKKTGGTRVLYTGVTFGVLRLLTSLLDQFQPVELLFAFEGENSLWRKRLEPMYKDNRAQAKRRRTPDEEYLARMFDEHMVPDLLAALRGLGVPALRVPKWEADDIIGTLAHATRNNPALHQLLIVSTDADFVQCVRTDRVRVYNPVTHNLYYQADSGDVMYGGAATPFAPSPKVFLWRKAVIGDASDHLRGAPNMGPAKAQTLFPERELTEQETLGEYMQRVLHAHTGAARASYERLVGVALPALQHALPIVDLVHDHAFVGKAKLNNVPVRVYTRRAYKRVQRAYAAARESELPKFLTPPLQRAMSPAFMWFRRRDFSVANNPVEFTHLLRRFDALWHNNELDALSEGDLLPCPPSLSSPTCKRTRGKKVK